MSLPRYVTAAETVEVEGEEIKVRALTRAEAARIQKLVRDDAPLETIEMAILAAGTDTTKEEARDWYESAPTYVVDPIILAIKRVSKMDDEAQKSGGESDSPGGG